MAEVHSYTVRAEPNGYHGWNLLLRRTTGEAVLECRATHLDKAMELAQEAIVRDCLVPGDPVVLCVHGQT